MFIVSVFPGRHDAVYSLVCLKKKLRVLHKTSMVIVELNYPLLDFIIWLLKVIVDLNFIKWYQSKRRLIKMQAALFL